MDQQPGAAGGTARDDRRRWPLLLWAAILIGIPLLVAALSTPFSNPSPQAGIASRTAQGHPSSPPPAVEPLEIRQIAPETARAVNAAIPFSTAPNPAARPFVIGGDPDDRARATDCLAAAELYEAGDDKSGQEAVAQVIINRMRHPAFPKTICGVVFQGAERTTGCQFTFTCDGALARIPSAAAWARARALASRMLSGAVDRRVGYATHYHTNWVVPYWSNSLDKITSVDSHLFFRWKGWWGTPGAFRGRQGGAEPAIARLAFLSPVHARAAPVGKGALLPLAKLPDFSDLATPAAAIGRDRIGERFGAARLGAINSAGDAFIMLIDPKATPDALEQLARQMCGGRVKCRLLGWTRTADMPEAFPIADAKLASMSYAYMRMTTEGLERSLYNCREFIAVPKARCMRERAPVARAVPSPTGEAPRTGTETVTLGP
ncbi:cell wall hydrolase [Sphingobium sufflavum]|uniref:cell wall hydrolase n=1 Tax=Sphingobium sufflavum TaxID=1129547 RepID=UPI001F25A8D4|nr:cell wall hydrolase [Sphingobium sufflavum]MCE7797479.1 cell wall hydrolase [Sphingobium sufflavum]